MEALQKDFSPDIARESLMKTQSNQVLASHQGINAPSDTSEHGRHFGHGRKDNGMAYALPNARTNMEDDTSLDRYIPCFVRKIKGMKPFLIDMKAATTFTRKTGNTSSYEKQYCSRKDEGTFCDFNKPYSTAPTPDFRKTSHETSWPLDPRNEELNTAPRQASQIPPLYDQPLCGPNFGNRAATSRGKSYYAGNSSYRAENYIRRSSPSSSRLTPPTRNYKITHQHGRNNEMSIRGPRIGKGKGSESPDRDEYNKKDFVVCYEKARFFMIKSYSENDVYNSMKYSVWSSTPNGNRKLDLAYHDAQISMNQEGNDAKCPIFLFFSVNSSGQFVGLAEMLGPVDFKKSMDFWLQDRWSGFFPLKWHIVKDIPNYKFRDITLENNDNKVVTFSRDTQEIGLPQGLKMLNIFKEYEPETSLLDDFEFYEEKERHKLAKKNTASQCSDDELMEYLEEEMRKLSFPSARRF